MKNKKRKKTTCKVIKGADMSVDIPKRTIIMSGHISRKTAMAFQKALYEMQNDNLDEIVIRIGQGRGGCAIASMMIYGLLRNCFAPTKCIVEGYAYSGSFIVSQGAAKRVMRKKARLRFHWTNIMLQKNIMYDIVEIGACLFYVAQMNEGLYAVIKERTNLSMGKVQELFATEAVITAKMALKFSLADEIE